LVIFYISIFSTLIYADEDIYIEDDSEKETFVETSQNKNDQIEENVKSRTETQQYKYDIEIYPYVSVRYTSLKSKKEDIEHENFN
jgi:hypothetical protein